MVFPVSLSMVFPVSLSMVFPVSLSMVFPLSLSMVLPLSLFNYQLSPHYSPNPCLSFFFSLFIPVAHFPLYLCFSMSVSLTICLHVSDPYPIPYLFYSSIPLCPLSTLRIPSISISFTSAFPSPVPFIPFPFLPFLHH